MYQNVLSLEGNQLKDAAKQVGLAPKGKSVEEKTNDMICTIEKLKPIKPTVERKTWSATETFRSIQGGLLCKGLYLVGDVDELEKEREPVIDVRDNFEFEESSLVSEMSHREFMSQDVTEDFEDSIDKNRSSKSGYSGLSFWGIGVGLSGCGKKKTKDSDTSEQYASSIHYQLVPVRSLHLTEADVVLRPDVIQKLQDI